MKKVAQIYPEDWTPEFINGWRRYLDKIIILNRPEDADRAVPFIIPANPLGYSRKWMMQKLPFFAINRPYVGSWLSTKRFSYRVSVNSFACTQLGNFSHSRWSTTKLDKQPWKVRQIKNVLIAPSRKSQTIFTGQNPESWSTDLKKFFEENGCQVRIRPKTGKKGVQHWGLKERNIVGLLEPGGDFDWADLVVSYSSAITAEAFWYGKKAISLGVCPTWVACEKDLSNWNNPSEPVNRNVWHEHISWVQFNFDEWNNGSAQEMTVHYQGWPTAVSNTNNKIPT